MKDGEWLSKLIPEAIVNFRVSDNLCIPAVLTTMPRHFSQVFPNVSYKDAPDLIKGIVAKKINYFSPLPLTEDLIEKTRFIKEKEGIYLASTRTTRAGTMCLEKKEDGWCFSFVDLERKVKYFSDLQHAIYSIPGETIKWFDMEEVFSDFMLIRLEKDGELNILL